MSTTARGIEINHSEVPIRLFKSDFLEFFTHISPVAVLVIWVPVALFFLARAVLGVTAGGAWWVLPVAFILGLALWTFTEYTLHRFLFHYHAKGERAQRVFFLFHGVHHAQPQLKTRLVMPPILSIPLALVFYGLFYFVIGQLLGAPQWVAPMFAGFIVGYLIYDMMHYATHHFPMRSGYLKYIKRYHMAHHFKQPDALYGVSSPVWDRVFRTDEA
jgi:sterol desaturase/sphingolipid hydroxylase (fatty acid hydroxylase superfamily)